LPRRLTLGSSRLILIAGGVLALIVGFPSLLSAKGGDGSYAVAIVFMVLAGMLGCLIGAEIESGRTLVGRGVSRLPFRAVRDIAVGTFGSEGWVYGGETHDCVWYSRGLSPNWAMVAILAVLGVIPALIYLAVSRQTQRAEVRWEPSGGLTAIEITVSPKGYGGQRIANELAQKLT
jgi:hypothetical protein